MRVPARRHPDTTGLGLAAGTSLVVLPFSGGGGGGGPAIQGMNTGRIGVPLPNFQYFGR